jgi:hypothetical protein
MTGWAQREAEDREAEYEYYEDLESQNEQLREKLEQLEFVEDERDFLIENIEKWIGDYRRKISDVDSNDDPNLKLYNIYIRASYEDIRSFLIGMLNDIEKMRKRHE